MTRERERERERIKANRNANGKIEVKFFSGTSIVLLSDYNYDQVADLYEKYLRREQKVLELREKREIVEGEMPKHASFLIWREREWNEKNVESLLLGKEVIRCERKGLKYLEEIEKKLDFSKLKIHQKEKTEFIESLDRYEKQVNRILEGYKKRGFIGDFEAEGNVKKIIKNFLSKEKFESRAEVKPLLDQIREGMGAPVNRWLLGKIWANPITQLFLILGIIVGLLKVLWRQFVKENN